MKLAKDKLPRTLLISPNGFYGRRGGSVLLRNAFSCWNAGDLASLYVYNDVDHSADLRVTHYRLPGRVELGTNAVMQRMLLYARGRAETLDGIFFFRPTAALRNWIDSFAPDLLYTHLGPPWMMRLIRWAATYTGAPMIIHVMDDFISAWPVSGNTSRSWIPCKKYFNAFAKREFARCLDIANYRVCISQSMAEEYKTRYGFCFDVLSNGIDASLWSHVPPSARYKGQGVEVMYCGSIAYSTNAYAILDLANVVSELKMEYKNIFFTVVSHNCPSEIANRLNKVEGVSITPGVSHNDIPSLISSADLLVMPFNFDSKSQQFFRLSWPTKLFEYMASGVPVLFYGPGGTAFGDYLNTTTLGYIVTTKNRESLKSMLRKVLFEENRKALNMAKEARRIALSRFTTENMTDMMTSISNIAILRHAGFKKCY